MINFNLATNRFFRKFVGFLTIGITVYLTIDKINTNLEVLLFLFGIVFSAYFVLEYSSYGSEDWVTIDFRTQEEQERDIVRNRKKLVEGSINNLLVEASLGNISESEVDRRLKTIEKIYTHMNTLELPPGEQTFLELPKNTDYV